MSYENVINEPVKDYRPGSKERKTLLIEYERQSNEKIEIPIIIGGEKYTPMKSVIAFHLIIVKKS